MGPLEGQEKVYGLVGDGLELKLRITLSNTVDGEVVEREYGVIVGAERSDGGRYARAILEGEPSADVFVMQASDLGNLSAAIRDLPNKEPEEKDPDKEKDGAEKDGKKGK